MMAGHTRNFTLVLFILWAIPSNEKHFNVHKFAVGIYDIPYTILISLYAQSFNEISHYKYGKLADLIKTCCLTWAVDYCVDYN
jgi:hypothetical protein